MKTALVFVGILLLAAASAQQDDETRPNAVIHGIAVGRYGQPAKRIGLTAEPLGVVWAQSFPTPERTMLANLVLRALLGGEDIRSTPTTKMRDTPALARVPLGGLSPVVELTPEHPEAELQVLLPSKAGFIQVHLTNRETGAGISAMRVALMLQENPASPVFTMSCYSNHVILVPPDKNLLLHVTSDGFREWNESTGKGKVVHLASGARLKMDVQLEPTE